LNAVQFQEATMTSSFEWTALILGFALLASPALAAAPERPLSPNAQALLDQAFADFEQAELVDYHVHMLGLGSSGQGASVSPRLLSWQHPISRIKAKLFFKASGISDENDADRQYADRLLSLSRGFPRPYRLAILAFDARRDKNGHIEADKTEIHTPSSYVLDIAKRYPNDFIPVVSVHPYDPEALAKLDAYADQGARIVKWLPNAQGMDPSDPAIGPYYKKMADRGMILLCHTGLESAVHSPEDQRLGNPLLLRNALDHGVTVIMAHAGNRGESADLDHPGQNARNFDLWLRMMDDPKYKDLLFADISTATQTIRSREDLKTLLARTDLHPRLVNGSDYPLPGLPFFIVTYDLMLRGFITKQERRALNEIKQRNPLLFDFVLKRALKHPATGAKFPPGMFMANPALANSGHVLQTLSQSMGSR
jgi:predicted TIM-barrel fold metal-dependent hydrolase